MRNKFSFTAILLCLGTPLFAQFSPADYKNKSNSEIVAELKSAVEQIKSIERFSNLFKDDKEVFYDKDELEPAFKLDSLATLAVFEDFRSTDFSIVQTLNDKGSELHIDDGDFHGNLSGKMYKIKMNPKRFYFYDGTTSDSVQQIEMDFSFTEDIPFTKRIDSIACELQLSQVTAFDKVEVTTLKPLAKFKGHFIKLLKASKNDIEVIFDSELDYNFVEGLNAAGNPLDDKSHTTTDYRDRDFRIFSALLKPLEKIVTAAEKDTSLAVADFQQKYMEQLEREFAKIPESDTNLLVAKYKGAVKGLRMWIATNRSSRQVPIMLKSAHFGNVHYDEEGKNGETRLRDNDGKLIFSSKESFGQITPNFYEGEQKYYFFNQAAGKMEPLLYYSVKRLTDNYVVAKEDEGATDIILDNKGGKIGAFDAAKESGGAVMATKGTDVLILSPSGKQTWIKDAEMIDEVANGYAVLHKNDKYGFINMEGKIVIPFEYKEVQPFNYMHHYTDKDQLFGVKKGDKWGFVDAQNKVVIPFEYEDIETFSYGITMAKKDGKRGLINTSNKVIVPFVHSGSYTMSTNFGKRLYSLSGGAYNHLGQKEKE
jgi:hypothetical protein